MTKRPRYKRTSGKEFQDLFEPPRFGFQSLSMDKIDKRREQGLCIACGKTPSTCICKSTSKVRMVETFYVSDNELAQGITSKYVTNQENEVRRKKYGQAYYDRWRAKLKGSSNT